MLYEVITTDSVPEDDARQNVTIRYIAHFIKINEYKLTKKHSEDQEVDSVKWIPLNEISYNFV